MDGKILRVIIYLFLGLIALSLILILVNVLGSRLRPEPRPAARDNVADSYLQGHLTTPVIRQKLPPDPGTLPSGREGLSAAAAGTMMVVRNKNFGGVAERPGNMIAELNKKEAERNKPAPISINGLSGAIVSPSAVNKEPGVPARAMPELGQEAGGGGVALVKVEVSYKLFRSSEVWRPFCESHKIKDAPVDFVSWDMLILVPGGGYPAGILSVAAVEKGAAETVVKYRVDPLAMSAGAEEGAPEKYAFAPVPKKYKKIRLLQVP
jgi:hypothetical protein